MSDRSIRLEKYIQEHSANGGSTTLSAIANRFNMGQKNLLAIIEAHPRLDFKIGYTDESGKWQEYTYIGEYRVYWDSDWDQLRRDLQLCNGRHKSPEVNEAIARILEVL